MEYSHTYLGSGILLTIPLFCRIFIKYRDKKIKFADLSLIIGIILFFAVSSLFPWKIFPFTKLAIIQFPWRLFQVISFLFACSGGIYLSVLSKKGNKHFLITSACVIITIIICINLSATTFKRVKTTYVTNQNYDLNIHDYLGIGQEYLPSRVPSVKYLTARGDKISLQNPDSRISGIKRSSSGISFDTNISSVEKATLPLTYYKGYSAVSNNEILRLEQSKDGLVMVTIPQSGIIKVSYQGTPLQSGSRYISLITFIAILIIVLRLNKTNHCLLRR